MRTHAKQPTVSNAVSAAHHPMPAELVHHEEQRRRVWDLYCRAWGVGAIATELGLTRLVVAGWIGEAMKSLKEERKAYAADILLRELEHLDLMERVLIEDATGLDINDKLGVVDRILKIKERRSKYLGLDSALKANVTVTTTLEDLVVGRTEDNSGE